MEDILKQKGNGWEVIEPGVDVKPKQLIASVAKHPGGIVGLSALLTTTLPARAQTIESIKAQLPETSVIVGIAPLPEEAAREMCADGYAPDPHGAV